MRQHDEHHAGSRRAHPQAPAPAHKWAFKARFRRHAFGWKSSQLAVRRIREAVSEIGKVARKDRLLAAEGAVIFLERVSPALEHVNSSSGALGSAINAATDKLVPIIAGAAADAKTRDAWLERLFDAYQDDEIPYIELLGDRWGELCASKEVASRWADQLLEISRLAWSGDPSRRGFFKGTSNCLSALLAAERYTEVLELLELAPYKLWHERRYGVRALVALGRKAEAIRYAEESRGLNVSPVAIARACEEVLLSSGFADEAYERYGLEANRAGTYLAWFRAVTKKYPHRPPADILADLVRHTPGEEGKWFAAAKDAKLFGAAIDLANRSPCSPQTLTRAARDFAETNPSFAIEAGITALRWLIGGYAYEIGPLDVSNAYAFTMKAARSADRSDEVRERVRQMAVAEPGDPLAAGALTRLLGTA